MNNFLRILMGFLLLGVSGACEPDIREHVEEDKFKAYWYQGKAEINSFDLRQMRYGEPREGKAVMIFVTEDFSRRKQVKLDQPDEAGSDARKVLKLNMTREFNTGVYPYHTMLSVFTPVVDELPALKITSTVTEWCGQAFTQLNWKNSVYQAQLFSYFEGEGDQTQRIDARSEDEVFNLIRLSPKLVPTGVMPLIPSLTYQRFSHQPLKSFRAEISLEEGDKQTGEVVITYIGLGREVRIRYTKAFPHEILDWEEIQRLADGTKERTHATRKRKILLDYWNRNSLESDSLRNLLKF